MEVDVDNEARTGLQGGLRQRLMRAPRVTRAAFLVLVFIAVSVTYAPALSGAFVWDDHVLVEHDTRCRDALVACFSEPFFPKSSFTDASPPYYRPIVTMSFAAAGGARAQHLVNVLLHALNACLLVLVMMRFRAPCARASAFALVWALHPRLVEGVAWVSGRTDILCATFVFAALLAWPRRENDRTRVVLALVFLFFGLLAKEAALAGAVALVLGAPRKRIAGIAATVGFYAVLRFSVMGVTHFLPSSLTPLLHAATVLEAIGRYASMTVYFWSPWSTRGAIGVISTWYALGGAVALLALVFVAWRAAKSKNEGLVVGAALGMASLLAVAHIFPIGLSGAVTGDRLLYLPLAGALLCASAMPATAFERPILAAAVVLAVAGGLSTRHAVHAFDDEVELWLTLAERAHPLNAGPRGALASVVRDRGLPELACPLFETTRHVLEDRRRWPAYRRASENLAACYSLVGRYDESAALYRQIDGDNPSGRVKLGLGYAELHRLDFDAASAAFAAAATLDPTLTARALNMRQEVDEVSRERGALDSSGAQRARYLARVGRAVEAERDWLALATDEYAPRPLRIEAVRYLSENGDPETAARAERAVHEPMLAARIESRRALAKTVTDRLERIVSLSAARPRAAD